MLSSFRFWREQGWHEISAEEYAVAWLSLGGSVATHPQVVERLADLAGIAVRYLAVFDHNGTLHAAIATWGKYLALSKEILKAKGKRGLYDLGNAEIIIPATAEAKFRLRHRVRYLSHLNHEQVITAVEQSEGLALAREPEDYSKKFRYNQRREQRLLEEAGGVISPILDLSPSEQARIYADLFKRRWGFEATGKNHLSEVFSLLREFMTGQVIYLNDLPVAIQILYRVEAPRWISLEYINGGVDPEQREFSPGSVLSYINTQEQWAYARSLNKTLRYSFGRADREYKERWCHKVPVYQV